MAIVSLLCGPFVKAWSCCYWCCNVRGTGEGCGYAQCTRSWNICQGCCSYLSLSSENISEIVDYLLLGVSGILYVGNTRPERRAWVNSMSIVNLKYLYLRSSTTSGKLSAPTACLSAEQLVDLVTTSWTA